VEPRLYVFKPVRSAEGWVLSALTVCRCQTVNQLKLHANQQ